MQKSRRAIVQTRLQDIHAEIVSTMKQVYTVFKNDGPEVCAVDYELSDIRNFDRDVN